MLSTKNRRGWLLATAAAALFASGAVLTAGEGAAEEAKVQCGGINACKGQTDCKTAPMLARDRTPAGPGLKGRH
jgi:uncharacterized membrane protein